MTIPSSRNRRAGAAAFPAAAAVLSLSCSAPPPAPEEPKESPRELVERSIAYHDPGGVWESAAVELRLVESRPDRPDRTTEIRMDAGNGRVSVTRATGDGATRFETAGDTVVAREVDGETDLDEEAFAERGLSEEGVLRLRNYYLYLWGLPMKLRDPGAIFSEEVVPDTWEGQEALRVRVTYDPEVGGDTWYFYFDPADARLLGYRFHHDEEKNDGEYILLGGEVAGGGLRLPAKRSWYWNDDGGFLGDDEAVSLRVLPPEDAAP